MIKYFLTLIICIIRITLLTLHHQTLVINNLIRYIMKKIYLVYSFKCNVYGQMLPETRKVFEVFTNKSLADKCADRMNEDWRRSFDTGSFSGVLWFTVQLYFISHEDYSKKLPF